MSDAKHKPERSWSSIIGTSAAKPLEETKFPKPQPDEKLRCAYACLVMRGDAYVPGALVVGHSSRCVKSRYPLVCMVTEDVSTVARERLAVVFDRVVAVPYIRHECHPMRTTKQQGMYASWMNDSFTKWNILSFTEYDKVMFLDADKVVFANLDHLFALRTPAGTFSSPWASGSVVGGKSKSGTIPNPYAKAKHGQRITADQVTAGLKSAFVVIGTTIILSPSTRDYEGFKFLIGGAYSDSIRPTSGVMLAPKPPASSSPSLSSPSPSSSSFSSSSSSSSSPSLAGGYGAGTPPLYGWRDCYSMFDEQSITEYYQTIGREWTYIHQQYNAIPWHPQWLEGKKPQLFHYFNKKPWDMSRGEWLDCEAYWLMAEALCKEHKELRAAFPLDKLDLGSAPGKGVKPRGCAWCKEQLKLPRSRWESHNIFGPRGELTCPNLG